MRGGGRDAETGASAERWREFRHGGAGGEREREDEDDRDQFSGESDRWGDAERGRGGGRAAGEKVQLLGDER